MLSAKIADRAMREFTSAVIWELATADSQSELRNLGEAIRDLQETENPSRSYFYFA